jgi:predicted metal-dependent HD superfamily phosphohydrolase
MDVLLNSWQRAWQGLAAQGDGASLRDALCQAYAEPQRHYHTQQHLRECLALFAQLENIAERPAELAMALWFHDAIYDPQAHDNEQRSADWAVHSLPQSGVAAEAVQRIAQLVLITQHSALPQTPDACLLVDSDLSILAAAPARFAEYEAQIRAEYAFVPDALFRKKRQTVLQNFANRAQIYNTYYGQQHFEAAAKANLQRAIASLN